MPLILIAASTAAAFVHFALGPEHLEELGTLGLGFYLAGMLQAAWALAAVVVWRGREPRPRVRTTLGDIGIGLNAAVLVAWVVSRVVGLPAGADAWTPEPVGLSDSITALLEAGLVATLLVRRGRSTSSPAHAQPGPESLIAVPERPSLVGAAPMLALILVATVTAVGAPHAHAEGAAHDVDVPAGSHSDGVGTGHSH